MAASRTGNVAPGNQWRTALRACDRARQRKGRLGQIDHRDAYRGRAAQGRAARRHHRSRLPAEELHPLRREPPRLGAAQRLDARSAAIITASRAPTALASTRTRRPSSAASPRRSTTVEHTHDFVVIDTPGNDTYLMRLAHSMADTLITPLNDSFVDFDVLGTRRSGDLRGHRREPLRQDGARRAAPAPHRRSAD